MKSSHWLLCAALALGSGQAVAEDRRATREGERAEWNVDRRRAETNLRKELAELRERITRLGRSGKSGADDAAARLSRRAERLEDRIDRLSERSARSWERTRDRIRREYEDLSGAIRDWERRRSEREKD